MANSVYPSLSRLLASTQPKADSNADKEIVPLQEQMLRVQQGIWHSKSRAIIVFEGFDAAGKGGVIRRLVEKIDPRGYRVHAIGPPFAHEQEIHYLYRFWQSLPSPGNIAVFDRSWYGRVLVEKVEKLTPVKRCEQAYHEIIQFEKMLVDDGIIVIKIFLAISKDEQLKRFESRLRDPYKQWKLTKADVEGRKRWDDYVQAVDEMFKKTHSKDHPWYLVAGDNKPSARLKALKIVTEALAHEGNWIESRAQKRETKSLAAALKDLGLKNL